MVDTDEHFSRSREIVMMGASALTGCSIQEYMGDLSTALSVTCTECSNELVRSFSFTSHLPLLCIELWERPRLLDSVLHIDAGGLCQWYKLRGVVYFSGEHFTSRVITGNGMV